MNIHSPNPEQLPVIILAAGSSDRMGQPKPFLKWDKHTTFLEKLIMEYSSFEAREIIIVMNREGYEKVKTETPAIVEYAKIVINEHPEKGRLSSIKLGLQYLKADKACYIQNADNPFVTSELLDAMDHLVESDACVVPIYQQKGGHPVLIGSKIIDYILSFEKDDADFRELLNNFRWIEVETDDKNILANINTLDDYKNYFN
jgi:molybdenum cofactor cytidylyltransferase